MTQTVFTVGNPITSRLKLGVTPDGTTNVALTVQRPDGTTIPTPAVSAWTGDAGDEKTAQWYATDDGASGSTTLAAIGDWVAVWTVTGKGAVTAAKVYNVAPLPSAGTRPAWYPFLSEVADHVPWLTVDQITVGADTYLGTFNGKTVPTDEIAQRHIDRAAAPIIGIATTIPTRLMPFARSVVAVRAAASLARAYPRQGTTPDALQIATALERQATTDWTTLLGLLEDEGSVPGEATLPVWSFPTPVAYPGDHNL